MPSFTGITAWIIGGLALLLVSAISIEEIRIGNWSADYDKQGKTLTDTQKDLTTAQISITGLQASLNAQNAAVAALKAKATKLEADAAARAKAAIAAKKALESKTVGYGPAALNDWLNKEYGGVE